MSHSRIRIHASMLHAVAAGLLLTLLAAPGHASPSAGDRAAAETLFNDALSLLDKQEPAKACPKLEASHKLDPGVGTLLYLADCYQQLGRTASAWGTFLDAAYRAKNEGQSDRETIATEHADALKAKLSYLTLEVSAAPVAELSVTCDGKPMAPARWGTPFPIDPGIHVVEATAPGKQAWAQEVDVTDGPGQHRVVVPQLENTVVVPTVAPPAPPVVNLRADTGGSGQETLGWIVLGTGGAAVIASGIFALLARSDDSDADRQCRPDLVNRCNEAGVALGDSAQTKATLAGISAGVGLAALGAGITLLVMAPSDSDQASANLSLRAQSRTGGGMLSLRGTW